MGSETIFPGLNLAALPWDQMKEEGLGYKSARGQTDAEVLPCKASQLRRGHIQPFTREPRQRRPRTRIPSDVGGVGVTAPYPRLD